MIVNPGLWFYLMTRGVIVRLQYIQQTPACKPCSRVQAWSHLSSPGGEWQVCAEEDLRDEFEAGRQGVIVLLGICDHDQAL